MCNNYLCDTSSCNTSICNIIGNSSLCHTSARSTYIAQVRSTRTSRLCPLQNVWHDRIPECYKNSLRHSLQHTSINLTIRVLSICAHLFATHRPATHNNQRLSTSRFSFDRSAPHTSICNTSACTHLSAASSSVLFFLHCAAPSHYFHLNHFMIFVLTFQDVPTLCPTCRDSAHQARECQRAQTVRTQSRTHTMQKCPCP